jgi:hypothetical protein
VKFQDVEKLDTSRIGGGAFGEVFLIEWKNVSFVGVLVAETVTHCLTETSSFEESEI